MADPAIHPMAPHHLPHFVPTADGGDYLMTVMAIFLFVGLTGLGALYLTLHALPERMGHKANSMQMQLISILAVVALFTHNNLFWMLALVLAAVRFPDYLTPLNSIAESVKAMRPAGKNESES